MTEKYCSIRFQYKWTHYRTSPTGSKTGATQHCAYHSSLSRTICYACLQTLLLSRSSLINNNNGTEKYCSIRLQYKWTHYRTSPTVSKTGTTQHCAYHSSLSRTIRLNFCYVCLQTLLFWRSNFGSNKNKHHNRKKYCLIAFI